jgi:hypothetical protein
VQCWRAVYLTSSSARSLHLVFIISHLRDALHLPYLKDIRLDSGFWIPLRSRRRSQRSLIHRYTTYHQEPSRLKMFNWLKRKKPDSDELELQDTSPHKIRKPTHAARDARMSIPVGEREYYDILEARKRANIGPPSIGTSVMKGKGKGKARSPLAYPDSGECLHILSRRAKSNS